MKPDRPNTNTNSENLDILIIGAGLAGLCLAYQVRLQNPRVAITILDENETLPDNRTWSFHESDIENLESWRPFICSSWPGYQVTFSYQRQLNSPYHRIAGKHFFEKMRAFLGDRLRLNVTVSSISGHQVTTTTGDTYFAPFIVDTRPNQNLTLETMKNLGWGFQKFYGQEVLLRKPHELKLPILMDASVRQTDGYRFMYVLPLDENRLLIEDTFYSNTFDLNHELSAKEIAQYAQQNSWEIQSVERTESGCLPLPTTSALSMATAPLQTKNNFTCALGMGGGFFHPVTGYSFPWAVRVAEAFSFESGATSSTLSGSEWASKYETLKQEFQDTESFYLLLNRLMFHGATTASRRAIFDRFYRLPESTIKRFYAGRSHWGDRVRLLAGKPPIPLTSAISAILKRPPTLTQGTGENFK